MEKDTLKEMVRPYENNPRHPYYRPFVSRGNQNRYNVFLVGINPATPIYEHEIELDKYVDLLTNYDEFHKEYHKIREDSGEVKMSRTRLGITSFVNNFESLTGGTVLETNVIPYPTKNVKELKKVQSEAIAHGLNVFYSVLLEHSPKIIIVYSKTSLKYLVNVLYDKDIISNQLSISQKIRDMENSEGPFIEFKYKNGNKGAIFVCRHFMYYGKRGKTFSNFKDKVIRYLKKV